MKSQKTILRLSILVVVIGVIGYVVFQFVGRDQIKGLPAYDSLQSVGCCSQILCFGDSSITAAKASEYESRTIGDMLGAYYPGLSTGSITVSPFDFGVIENLIQQLPQFNRVKTIVLSFRVGDLGPLYGIAPNEWEKQTDGATDALKFPFKTQVTNRETWLKNIKTKNLPADLKAKQELIVSFVRQMAYNLDSLNSKAIDDLDDIAKLCKAQGIQLVLQILPEDIKTIKTVAGAELEYLLHENARVITKRYTSKGALVINNLESVPGLSIQANAAGYQRYSDGSRRTIAKNLAVALQPIHPSNYHQATKIRYFKNTFEHPSGWHSEGKVVDNMAFKGRRSCIINKDGMFSSTFRYSLANLEPAKFSDVLVNFRCKADVKNTKISLVISIENEAKGNSSWFAFPVAIKDYEEWNLISESYKLPQYAPEDFVKIYVINNDASTAYIDDFVVEFPEN